MASKRQMQAQIRKLEDALNYERAKLSTAVKIVRRLSSEENDERTCRLTSYWLGYWQGKGSQNTIPNFERDF